MTTNPKPVGAAVVVGSGIAGVQAALDMANSGVKVYLVERESAIGGKMVQLDKTFPTNDCAMCISSPKLVDAGRHPNIEVLANAELVRLEGQSGRFTATVRSKPRYIDPDKCTACGDCAEVCPVVQPNPFNAYLDTRHAAHKRYPQAVPNAYTISKEGIAPCQDACPAHQRAQGYIALIREQRYDDALRVIKVDNPFPGVCGRICNHRCEDECNRGKVVDDPISIASLKRFATDMVYSQPRQPVEAVPHTRDERVAVIGAGPAGLTCAQDLVTMGYGVTVYEALPVAGGMFRVAVPEFRLPAWIAEREVQDIVDLGVDLRLNHRVASVDELFDEGYDAVLIATGAHKGRKLPLPGADLEGTLVGIDVLRDVRLKRPVPIGKDVIVLGGGSVALDTARTILRLGAERVRIVCLESGEQMPCHDWEASEAEEEGVTISAARSMLEITEKDGHVAGLRCVEIEFHCFLDGRPDFDVIPGTECVFPADTIVFSIGQGVDPDITSPDTGITTTRRRTVEIDPNTMATGRSGVFAAGDAVTGVGFVIEAVAAGHKVANSIHRYLQGEDDLAGLPKPEQPVVRLTEDDIVERRAQGTIKGTKRVSMPSLPIDQRMRRDAESDEYVEVELGLTPELASEEAARCLECGLCSECLSCWFACQAGAVEHDQVAQEQDLEVGAVVLAPGYSLYDATRSPEWGYGRFANVVHALEFERMLSASGPTRGHIARMSDGAEPKRIAFLQCVGSRDQEHPYCSSVCCMYATKEAMLVMEHVPGVEVHVFQMDMRAFGKSFDAYYRRGQDHGVVYHNCRLSVVHEDPETREIIARYQNEDGTLEEMRLDLLVLSVGMEPPENVKVLAETVGIGLNEHGFALREPFHPVETSRPGVFVCGAFAEPKDIPDSVVEAGGAAASVLAVLGESRGTLVEPMVYPPEKEVALSDAPRIGCFVCSCGSNIAGVIDVAGVTAYADSLNGVVYADNTTYTCSADSLKLIQDKIEEYDLNRVIVASCTPRTHEPIFRETIRGAGLNPYLFEMANIRDQGSWVHSGEPARATAKAKDLVRMAVARSRLLFSLHTEPQSFNHGALVVGGGVAGMTAALNLADQGYRVNLVERDAELGGRARRIFVDALGGDMRAFLADVIDRVQTHERIEVLTHRVVVRHKGYVGNFQTTVQETEGLRQQLIEHGVVVMATGAEEYAGSAYGLGTDARIMTQGELEARLEEEAPELSDLKQVVMIQCVGPWDEPSANGDAPMFYCSRVCCTVAIKNALKIKERYPDAQVYVLYRDIRTYGFREQMYTDAREKGVMFIRFDPADKPQVVQENGRVTVTITDPVLNVPLLFEPDALVLAAAMEPPEGTRELAEMMRFACTLDGFMLEAHLKLQPVDFPTEGAYLCGAIQYPKFLDEAIAQAKAAAARAASILSQDELQVGGEVAVVDALKCTGCLTCVRVCPYDAPVINPELIGAGGIRGAAEIAAAACRGCGICAGECPAKAIQLQHARDEQILAKAEALFFDDLDLVPVAVS